MSLPSSEVHEPGAKPPATFALVVMDDIAVRGLFPAYSQRSSYHSPGLGNAVGLIHSG